MAVRYYLSPFAGDGSYPNPFRPAVFDAVSPSRWQYQDGRADQAAAGGVSLCWADVTAAEHAAVNAVAGVTYVPFEDAAGNVLPVSAFVGDVSAANRTAMSNYLEARHVPTNGILLTDAIYVAVNRVLQRFRVRQYLLADDYTEGLDTTVSGIPAAKRNRIKTALEALGYDLSAVTGTWTVRQVLAELIRQSNLVR